MKHSGAHVEPIDRFLDRVAIQPNGCILWTGKINDAGYGKLNVHKKETRAHRFSYRHYRGEIPPSLVMDHLCRNRACVNPDHLEPVTQKVNNLRGVSPIAINAKKTHCPLGHAFSGDNLVLSQLKKKGWRYCKTCSRARDKLRRPPGSQVGFYAKRKERANAK